LRQQSRPMWRPMEGRTQPPTHSRMPLQMLTLSMQKIIVCLDLLPPFRRNLSTRRWQNCLQSIETGSPTPKGWKWARIMSSTCHCLPCERGQKWAMRWWIVPGLPCGQRRRTVSTVRRLSWPWSAADRVEIRPEFKVEILWNPSCRTRLWSWHTYGGVIEFFKVTERP